MKFSWTTLIVKDLEKSLSFYQNVVGLNVNRRFKAGEKVEIAFLSENDGDTEVELICNTEINDIETSSHVSMGFVAEDLAEVMKNLDKYGFEYDNTVLSPNPHVDFFYAKDPNGFKVQFVKNK